MIALVVMKQPADREAVRRLGEAIGYGNLMQLAEALWGEALTAQGCGAGGAHSVGPCVGGLVPCPCDDRVSCDWCCGAGRVTERVASAMRRERGEAVPAAIAAGVTVTIDGEAKAMRPCPFCGRSDLLGVEPRPDSGFLGGRCRACGAIGPTGRSAAGEPRAEEMAIAHWNRR